MGTVSTVVNVNDACPPPTPGTFQVKVHYTEVDAGFIFGPFASREAAERCLLVVSGRTDIKKAELEVV